MDRKNVAGLLALGLVLGTQTGAHAAFMPSFYRSGASINEGFGAFPGGNIPSTQTISNETLTFTIGDYNAFRLEWYQPNATSSICSSYFGCQLGTDLDPTKNYFVVIQDAGGLYNNRITLTAGAEPFSFAYEISSVPLPASFPMFGAALLGLGGLAWRRLKGAPEASSVAADR